MRLIPFLAVLAQPALASFTIHLFSPWASDPARPSPPAFIMIQGKEPGYYPGTAMRADGGDWFSYVFANESPAVRDGFKFVDYLPSGGNTYAGGLTFDNGGKDFTMGEVFLTPGVKEAWIIPQGPGKPPLITDLPPHSKAVYLFNPWPETAPSVRLAGDTSALPMRPSADPARCGWYVHYFAAGVRPVSFRSRVGRESYGRAGLGDTSAIDLAAAFSRSDTAFLLPQPLPGGPPALSPAFPDGGAAGTCSFPLAVTIRDFSAQHPDFEEDGMEGQLHKGMVAPTLPPDKKPLPGPVSFFQSRFDQWFRTDSLDPDPRLRNYETCRDLSFSKDASGYWGHDSYGDPDHSFFPIDDFNRFNETYQGHYRDQATGKWVDGAMHNFHFCMEMHASFRYRQGQVFRFSGDDDVWVYIDNRLAIDIGGTHGPEADSVYVDGMGLTPGNKYDFDLYYCERKTRGSNLAIQTSIYFEQTQSVWAERTGLDSARERYDIFEILSGDKSCGAAPDGDTAAAVATFRLSGPGMDPPRTLPAGTSFGGIVIDPARTRVTLDIARMSGLAPGRYEIRFASDRSGRGGVIPFVISRPPVPVIPPVPIPALRGWVSDRDGDGRIDGAVVVFADTLPAPPARLDFSLADAFGHAAAASAAGPAIALVPGAPDRAQVTFTLPLPFGLTSLAAPSQGRTFPQGAGPLAEGTFPLADSAAPVLVAASIREPDSAQPLKRILLTLSEPAVLAGPEPLLCKRDGSAFAAGGVRLERAERVGDRDWILYVDPASEAMPVAGDSAALAVGGPVRDVSGNAPAHAFFRRLEGDPPARAPLDLFVTFANGSRLDPRPAAGAAPPALPSWAPAFIPVGRAGAPLPGRCDGCEAVRDGIFAGPVFHLQVPGPSSYAFRIFTNAGEFVASGRGRIEAGDLALLEKGGGPGGVRYRVRIVWNGRSAAGAVAGTGAFVLLAEARGDRDARTGAPETARTWKIRFGSLRGPR
jgi:fibro-slime domain-containing protein